MEIPTRIKRDIARLRSEVRQLQTTKKEINPFTGLITGNYWTQTGMPWVSGEGRKAVLTEFFWQPIRGQPRRVDTNELRQFSQTSWVSACVKTLMDEISSLDWDIVAKDEFDYESVKKEIDEVKAWLKNPNKNSESFQDIIKAMLKDILEVDAGVIVKVFDVNSYNFDELEPKSGAPLLKPLGQRKMVELYARDGTSFLKEIDKFGLCKGFWQYSYQIPAHPMWFNKDEITYISEHTRSMSCYGYARTQAVLDIIKSLHYSTLYNKRFFEETPIPDGALSLLDTNEVEMKVFMDYWNNEFKAQPHKLAVINKDIKWQPFNVSQRELEFLETQKWYYTMVISSFGLTPSEMGITDELNRSTSATQSEVVKRKGVRPFLKLIENAVNSNIIPEFGFEGIEFQFIYDDPSEKAMRLNNWQLELNMGIKTINEVREELGLEPIANGDMSNNMQMLAQSTNFKEGNESAQSGDYKNNLKREEGKPQEKKEKSVKGEKDKPDTSIEEQRRKENFEYINDRVMEPFSDANRPIGSFKGLDDYKKMSYDELISEHKRLVEILETGTDNDIKQEADKQRKELESYIEESKKSVNKKLESNPLNFPTCEICGKLKVSVHRKNGKDVCDKCDKESNKSIHKATPEQDKLSLERFKVPFDGLTSAQQDEIDIELKKKGLFSKNIDANEKKEIISELYQKLSKDIYLILQQMGMSPSQAANASRLLSSRKGINDGQYYHEPFEVIQPNKGKITQPQNLKPNDAEQMKPSQLGSDFRGTKDSMPTYDNKDRVNCPMCGYPSLSVLQAEETGMEDIRCGQCGSRFRIQELKDLNELQRMGQMLMANNSVEPVSIPSWSPKSYDNLTVKQYVGFDVNKSIKYLDAFIYSNEYISQLTQWLSDLREEQIGKIINILRTGIELGKSLSDISNNINAIINDKPRADLIARMETTRISNDINWQRMKDDGIEEVVWIGSKDSRACKECDKYINKVFKLKDVRSMIPLHPRCRCSWTEKPLFIFE